MSLYRSVCACVCVSRLARWPQIFYFCCLSTPVRLLWRRGCVSVCVSVTLMYCAQTTESIIMRPSPDCSPAILVFPYEPDSSRVLRAPNGRGVGKSRKIRLINNSHLPEGQLCFVAFSFCIEEILTSTCGRFFSRSWACYYNLASCRFGFVGRSSLKLAVTCPVGTVLTDLCWREKINILR